FFFSSRRRHTRSLRDWSSDVCSSDLLKYGRTFAGAYLLRRGLFMPWELDAVMDKDMVTEGLRRLRPLWHVGERLEPAPRTSFGRSEERRVGKECRCRWWAGG